VIENFHYGENETLRKYTTEVGYEYLAFIQAMFLVNEDSAVGFKILDQKEHEDAFWVKYTTAMDDTPGLLKLVQENGMWKVTQEGVRERGPF